MSRDQRPHSSRFYCNPAPHHRAIWALPTNRRGSRASRTRSPLLVDMGVHTSERVMSLAPGVGSHTSVVCLWTGVSSENWPMFDTKSRKCHAPLEGPVGTEYLEDAALEQRGKVRGSRRSPRQ